MIPEGRDGEARLLPFETVAACIAGAVSVETTPAGLELHRTSRRTRDQLDDPFFEFASATPSGVRIEASTDAAWIDLELDLTRSFVRGQTLHPIALDVIVDGALRPAVPLTEYTVLELDLLAGTSSSTPAGLQRLRVPIGPAGVSRWIEIWLPHAARMTLVALRIPVGASFAPLVNDRLTWVHHGSSISQCTEVERPTQTWPALVANRSGRSLVNMGMAGQCHLDQGVARSIGDLGAEAISLEIGINIAGGDTMHDRTFVSAFHGFLDTVRERAPRTPILVISPFYCAPIETHPGPAIWGSDGKVHPVERPQELYPGALNLQYVRRLLEQHVTARQDAGDTALHYLDGLTVFGEADADHLPDDLHPDTAGYARIAERLQPFCFGPQGVLR